jgi:hypothetical protein
VILTVTAHYMTLPVDVGDFVYLNSAFLPNFRAGQRGVVGQIFEVIEKQPNFTEGTMRYKLLDTSWFGSKKLSRIAPDGSPAWPTASESQRGKYMFACAEATLAYSDGTEGKTIF